MALTGSNVNRLNPTGGDTFATFTDGAGERHMSMVEVDAEGNPVAYGTNYATTAAEDSAVLKASAGQVGEIHAYQDGLAGTAVVFMLFNATSLPANGAAPVWRIPIVGGIANYWFPTGYQFSTGLVGAFSSTHATLTVTTDSQGFVHARSR